MSKSGLDLAHARVLVTNDDGIAAPGLKVMERIAKACAKDVWVVAPDSEQSAASHSLTLRRPLRVRKLGRRRFTVGFHKRSRRRHRPHPLRRHGDNQHHPDACESDGGFAERRRDVGERRAPPDSLGMDRGSGRREDPTV